MSENYRTVAAQLLAELLEAVGAPQVPIAALLLDQLINRYAFTPATISLNRSLN